MTLEITIESSSLTKYQKQIVKVVYSELKNNISDVIDEIKQLNPDNISIEDLTKKILIIISQCIKIIEKTKVNRQNLEGADKKQIVLELGKIILITEIEDTNITSVIVPIYDTISEEILETIIDVSSHVNIEVKKGCTVLFTKIKHNLNKCLK